MTSQERYELQVAIVVQLAAEWEAEGRPTTTLGGATGRSLVAHPLLRQLQDAMIRAERLDPARNRRQGRPVGALSAPDRAAPARVLRLAHQPPEEVPAPAAAPPKPSDAARSVASRDR